MTNGIIDLVVIDASFDPIDEWSLATRVYVEFESRFLISMEEDWLISTLKMEEGCVWSYAQVESNPDENRQNFKI